MNCFDSYGWVRDELGGEYEAFDRIVAEYNAMSEATYEKMHEVGNSGDDVPAVLCEGVERAVPGALGTPASCSQP